MGLDLCYIRNTMCFHIALVISLASIHVYEHRGFADFLRFARAAAGVCVFTFKINPLQKPKWINLGKGNASFHSRWIAG